MSDCKLALLPATDLLVGAIRSVDHLHPGATAGKVTAALHKLHPEWSVNKKRVRKLLKGVRSQACTHNKLLNHVISGSGSAANATTPPADSPERTTTSTAAGADNPAISAGAETCESHTQGEVEGSGVAGAGAGAGAGTASDAPIGQLPAPVVPAPSPEGEAGPQMSGDGADVDEGGCVGVGVGEPGEGDASEEEEDDDGSASGSSRSSGGGGTAPSSPYPSPSLAPAAVVAAEAAGVGGSVHLPLTLQVEALPAAKAFAREAFAQEVLTGVEGVFPDDLEGVVVVNVEKELALAARTPITGTAGEDAGEGPEGFPANEGPASGGKGKGKGKAGHPKRGCRASASAHPLPRGGAQQCTEAAEEEQHLRGGDAAPVGEGAGPSQGEGEGTSTSYMGFELIQQGELEELGGETGGETEGRGGGVGDGDGGRGRGGGQGGDDDPQSSQCVVS